MDNKIDKLFKQKLGESPIEFNETYWDSATKMIVAENNNNKKRRWLLLFLIGFVLVSASFVYYWNQRSNEGGIYSEIVMSDQERLSSKINENASVLKTPQPSIVKDERQDVKEIISNTSSLTVNGNPFDVKNVSKYFTTKENTELNTKPFSAANQTSNVNNSKSTKITAQIDDDQINSNNIVNPLVGLKSEKSEAIFSTQNSIVNSTTTRSLNQLAYLPLQISSLSGLHKWMANVEIVSDPPTQFDFGTKVIRRKLVALGLEGGVTSNGDLTGLLGGIRLRFDISRTMSLHTGARYSIVKGVSPITKRGDIRTFSFRSEVQIKHLKAEQFHRISLPIFVSYNINRHSVGLGMEWAYLNAIHGEIGFERGENSTSQNRKTWIVTDGFNKFSSIIGLHYAFELNKNLSLNTQLSYYTSGLVDRSYEQNNELNFAMKSKMSAGISVIYFLRP